MVRLSYLYPDNSIRVISCLPIIPYYLCLDDCFFGYPLPTLLGTRNIMCMVGTGNNNKRTAVEFYIYRVPNTAMIKAFKRRALLYGRGQ